MTHTYNFGTSRLQAIEGVKDLCCRSISTGAIPGDYDFGALVDAILHMAEDKRALDYTAKTIRRRLRDDADALSDESIRDKYQFRG